MPASYIGGKVPKLIVQDVFWNILRSSCAKKDIIAVGIRSCTLQRAGGEYDCHWTIETSMSL